MPAPTSDAAPNADAAADKATSRPGWLTGSVIAFGATAAIGLVFAFVGLGVTAFDIDELFTLYLVDHSGGLGEVFSRALGDTHPPLYYFLLHAWTRFTPITETMVRLPSAILACGAVLTFVWGTRREFSPAALAFAAALAALSSFFFQQSQYARDYPLALLGSAGLLACGCALRRGLTTGKALPALVATGLVGLLASLSHAYVLLQVGMVLLFAMLFWTRSWPTRGILAAIGLGVLAVNVAYFLTLMHATKEDLHDLWFSNSLDSIVEMARGAVLGSLVNGAELAVLVLLGALVLRWLKGRSVKPADGPMPQGAGIAQLAGLVICGTFVCGVAISFLVAPSMSQRNLLTASPFIWALFARLYDKTAGGWRGISAQVGVGMIAGLLALNLVDLSGRFLPRGEDFRVSARYIEAVPGCSATEIPALQPFVFGPDNTHFRDLARDFFYGRYMRGGDGVSTWMPAQIGGRSPAPRLMEIFSERAGNAGSATECPVLLWGVHDILEPEAISAAEDMARLPDVRPARIVIQNINSYRHRAPDWKIKPDAFVFMASPPAANGLAPPILPEPVLKKSDLKQVGDRIVVTYLSTIDSNDAPHVRYDVFSLQRWRGQKLVGEHVDTVQHFTCDPKVPASERRYWPNLDIPGCSPRPATYWPFHSPL
jgi:hypothetical protein